MWLIQKGHLNQVTVLPAIEEQLDYKAVKWTPQKQHHIIFYMHLFFASFELFFRVSKVFWISLFNVNWNQHQYLGFWLCRLLLHSARPSSGVIPGGPIDFVSVLAAFAALGLELCMFPVLSLSLQSRGSGCWLLAEKRLKTDHNSV